MTAEAPPLEFDATRAEEFAGKMMGVLNGSLLGLCTSVGLQTGLFDGMAGMAPATSTEIAARTGLQERYVREWLGAMVLGGIVEYDAAAKTYCLPPEHAAFVTTAAGPDNLAYFTQYIALFAAVEPQIIESFRTGGGVPYSAFARFQELQAGETRSVYDASLLQRTLPSIPGLVERLEAGIHAADFGCGSGHAINLMAKAFPQSTFTGVDISGEGIRAGQAEARALGLSNVTFSVQDVAQFHSSEAFDFAIAFDAIHDQADPRAVLAAIRRSLRPGGVFLMVDIAASSEIEENYEHPLGAALFGVSLFHCMTVSLAAGGEGLGAMWGEQQARAYLAEAGFDNVETVEIEGDFLNTYFVASV
jgi:SAM-dependent methyltransferase